MLELINSLRQWAFSVISVNYGSAQNKHGVVIVDYRQVVIAGLILEQDFHRAIRPPAGPG